MGGRMQTGLARGIFLFFLLCHHVEWKGCVSSDSVQTDNIPANQIKVADPYNEPFEDGSEMLFQGDGEIALGFDDDPKFDRAMLEVMKRDFDTRRLMKRGFGARRLMKKYTLPDYNSGKFDIKRLMKRDFDPKRLMKRDLGAGQLVKKEFGPRRLMKKDFGTRRLMKRGFGPSRLMKRDFGTRRLMKKDFGTRRLMKKDGEFVDSDRDIIEKRLEELNEGGHDTGILL